MPDPQLRLFPEPRPFLERFGAEFFLRIPPTPGVYVMTGERERVLYIGKARNLRQRLASYKYLKPTRKNLRLACRVRAITWELCDDEAAATLRENQLLRLHKPVFNVVNTRSEHYPFLGIRFEPGAIHLRLTKSPEPLAGENIYGAFKGLPLVRQSLCSLARLLWMAEQQPRTPFDFPSRLISRDAIESWSHLCAAVDAWAQLLGAFLEGADDSLFERLTSAMPAGVSSFQRAFHARDLEALADFYLRGPRRNAELRKQFDLSARVIPQSELDDLLALRAKSHCAGASGGLRKSCD